MDRSPYTPPASDSFSQLPDRDEQDRRKGRVVAIIGVFFFSGPVWGLVGTVIQMVHAFDTLAAEGDNSKQLAQDISGALVFAAIGGVIGLVGVVLVFIAFFASKNRENWFYWWSVILAGFWCLVFFPYGLIVGLPISILFIMRRAEFHPLRGPERQLEEERLD